jgi:Transglutaminase-like superfamily
MALWNQFLHRLCLARKLSLLDWLAFLEAWWVLLVFHWRLRWVSYERLTQTGDARLKQTSGQLSVAQRLHRLIGWASRFHLLRMTCLVQSLALRWMLGRRGIASELKIGAMKTQAGIHAHAWVEVEEQVIGDPGGTEKGFSAFDPVE